MKKAIENPADKTRVQDGGGLDGMEHGRCDEVLKAFFSDESEAFRLPSEPGPGQRMTVRLRAEKGVAASVSVVVGDGAYSVPMSRAREDATFEWFEASVMCGLDPVAYRFEIECDQGRVVYLKDGARWAECISDGGRDFVVRPGFRVPAWAKGAVQYQIFPDRFCNGNRNNDVVDGEVSYNGELVRHVEDWNALPVEDDYRCFYGGDLQGVALKLDYLQSLGVEAIYLNPLFVSPSSHKYDTQDYAHVDPHLACIIEDVDDDARDPDDDGRLPDERYVVRTTSKANLKASDDYFAGFCEEAHSRGMKIILDGVFNHVGSFSKWMDREGIYARANGFHAGAYHSLMSPYRGYFGFAGESTTEYEGWWDYPTLPKLNYEATPHLAEHIIGIARKWALPPYCIDGWRLDVAADLGHSKDYNHAFWRRFRDELKGANPDLLIVAEHYGDPSSWLEGDQWDTVMNYDAFMDPLTFFLTGMEKHSDAKDEGLYQDGERFASVMRENMARFGWGSLLCAMNELSNHDHSRFLTRTNQAIGRIGTAGSAAAGEGVDMRVMREAVVVQMTWPGAPTIYYGDEAGQVGWTDPDCRRTYPWGAEDELLIDLHRNLSRIRRDHPALRTGSFALIGAGHGWMAFGRFQGDDCVVVACNNAESEQELSLRLRTLGAHDGSKVHACLRTTEDGFDLEGGKLGKVKKGHCRIAMPARSALVATVVSPE